MVSVFSGSVTGVEASPSRLDSPLGVVEWVRAEDAAVVAPTEVMPVEGTRYRLRVIVEDPLSEAGETGSGGPRVRLGVDESTLELATERAPCPASAGPSARCFQTAPLRFREPSEGAIDDPIGGTIEVVIAPDSVLDVEVFGRHALRWLGPSAPLLLVPWVVVDPAEPGVPDGDVPIVAALQRAKQSWARCGVEVTWDKIQRVTPPNGGFLSIGCEGPRPSSGGTLALRVEMRDVTVAVPKGLRPRAVARLVRGQLVRAGFDARIIDQRPSFAFDEGASDVWVFGRKGEVVPIRAQGENPLSTDGAQASCIGEVNVLDGLTHFSNESARVGSQEERALLSAIPARTGAIRMVVVGGLSGDGRVGESFIPIDGGHLRSTFIVDRAGLRADPGSRTVAHELGHILLNQAGHPDDYGGDTPDRLMDSNASDASAHGPRGVSADECKQVLAVGLSNQLLKPPTARSPRSSKSAP